MHTCSKCKKQENQLQQLVTLHSARMSCPTHPKEIQPIHTVLRSIGNSLVPLRVRTCVAQRVRFPNGMLLHTAPKFSKTGHNANNGIPPKTNHGQSLTFK